MSRFTQVVLPSTRLGKWAVALWCIAIVIFVGNIIVVQSGNQVTNTNGVETLVNPEKINDSGWSLVLMYTIFAGFILGGVFGVLSLFKKERSVLVCLATLFGVISLWIFVGGFFMET